MKLELREHELEQAIEVFISSFVNKPVKVNGFDLSGMRSKDGLSAMVDFTVLGVSDVREPKTDSDNVHVTNTEWREKATELKEPVQPKSNAYYDILELLSNNPLNKHKNAILQLLKDNPEVEDELSTNVYYTKWKASLEDTPAVTTLDSEEAAMDELVLSTQPETNTEEEYVEEQPLNTNTVSVLDEVTEPENKQQAVDRVTQALSGTNNSTQAVRPLFG